MKKLMTLVIVAAAVCQVNAAQVANGGFELTVGSPAVPQNWTQYAGTGATVYFSLKTDFVHSGTYSEKVAARNGYGMIHQEISSGFTAGQTYSLWLYAKGDTNKDWQMDEPRDRIELSVKFKTASGATISEPMTVLFDADPETAAPILLTSQWLKSPVFQFAIPQDTASFLVKITAFDGSADGSLTDGTSIYVDDVTLDILPLPAKTPAPAAGAVEQSPTSVFLTWQPGDDPLAGGTPNPNVTGYYVYMDQFDSATASPEPNFINPVYIAGTQYPVSAPSLALGTDQLVFWRVDTSISGSTADDPNTVTGLTWSFQTESSFPEIIAQPQDVTVFEGESAVFSVEAVGVNPIVLYEWFNSNDEPVASGAAMSTLTLSSTEIEDSGAYYCVITNAQGKTAQSNAAALYVKGLLAQYDFENALTDARGQFDGTAKNIDPNLAGAVSYDAQGVSGSAVVLSGGNYIELAPGAYPNSYMGLASGTLSCWVKTTSGVTGTVIAAYNDGHTTCYNVSVQVPERLYFYIRTETNNVSQVQAAAPGIMDGNWHQIVATYALGSNSAIYMDGEQLATAGGLAASAQFAPWAYTLPIGAGDTRGVISNVYQGAIDSLVLYNYPKTQKEVLDMYNSHAAVQKSLCLDAYASAFDLAGPDGVGTSFADCRVDLYDFAAMAASWLDCGLYPSCGN